MDRVLCIEALYNKAATKNHIFILNNTRREIQYTAIVM